MWGSNIPMTRTPDAHFMTEARYRGQKTVVVSPDYSDHTKFADHWLPAHPGSDGALAMGMGHVILKEFYVDRQVPYFEDYARKFTDMPFLVTLNARDGGHVAGRFLRASDLGAGDEGGEHADWRTVVMDAATGEPAVPNGSIGDRWGDEGKGRWNLELGDIEPQLSLLGTHDELVTLRLPRFDTADGHGEVLLRGVPAQARRRHARHDGLRPHLRALRRLPRPGPARRLAEPASTTRSPTRRRGRRRSPASTRTSARASRASSPATPSARTAAR